MGRNAVADGRWVGMQQMGRKEVKVGMQMEIEDKGIGVEVSFTQSELGGENATYERLSSATD